MTRLAPLMFVLIWSTGFVVARAIAPHADPNLFLAARFALAALLLALLAAVARAAWPGPRETLQHLGVGGLLQGVYLGAGYWAVAQGLPAGIMALIGGLQPVVTVPLAAALFGEKAGPRALAGLALGISGVGLAVSPALAGAHQDLPPAALTAALVSVAAITAGTLAQKADRVAARDLRTAGAVQGLGAALVTAALALALGERRWDGSTELWAALAYAALGLSALGTTLLVWLVRRGAAASATALLFLAPPLAAVEAYVLFGEALSPLQLLGFVVALSGVLLLRSGSRERHGPQSSPGSVER